MSTRLGSTSYQREQILRCSMGGTVVVWAPWLTIHTVTLQLFKINNIQRNIKSLLSWELIWEVSGWSTSWTHLSGYCKMGPVIFYIFKYLITWPSQETHDHPKNRLLDGFLTDLGVIKCFNVSYRGENATINAKKKKKEKSLLKEIWHSHRWSQQTRGRAWGPFSAVYQNKQSVQSGPAIDSPAKYNLFQHHKSVSDICTKAHFSQTQPSKAVYSTMAW